jgi:hypothetical protein
VARIAARYDLSAPALATSLLRRHGRDPDETARYLHLRGLDATPWPDFDRSITAAAGLELHVVQDLRRIRYRPEATRWSRTGPPPWCQTCVATAAAQTGEVHWPAEWTFAGWVICPVHRCLLGRSCPCCARDCGPRPIAGRLRLWCPACARDVTTRHAGTRPALWPLSEPPRMRPCPAIVVDPRSRKTLVRMQTDLLRAATDRRPTGPWGLLSRPERFLEAVRVLSFLALAAAWQARPSVRRPRTLTPEWSLREEPPAAIAGVLAIVAAVLTSVIEPPWPGAAWTPELLRGSETPDIDTFSLCWHLAPDETDLLTRLLPTTLLTYRYAFARGLDAATSVLARNRETARRRAGFGGAQRLRDAQSRGHRVATASPGSDIAHGALAQS